MSLFIKKEEKAGAENKTGQKSAKKKAAVVGVVKKTTPAVSGAISEIASTVLIEPVITEKSHEKMAESKYIFRVDGRAHKGSVQRAVEELYGVAVTKVNIIRIPAKRRNVGTKIGWKSGHKKAVVTLKAGDKIELFEGV